MSDDNKTEIPATDKKVPVLGIAIVGTIAAIIIIPIIVTIVIIVNIPHVESTSYSKQAEEEIEHKKEFLDNLTTPGTSEYDWYHDKYKKDKK